ncbi:MAG: UvrB/UvrC motif-containing protein [Phycisphaerae bacterium]
MKSPPVPINEMLANFVMQHASVQELTQLKCPHCQTTFVEFRNAGLLGCARDYDVFEKALLPLLERAQEGNSRHVGKSPRRLGAPRNFQNELVRLRRDLTEAVEREDYEGAARIRDKISALETQ